MNPQLESTLREKIIASTEGFFPEMTLRDTLNPNLPNKAVVAIGMRRSGKTTWLKQCQKEYIARGLSREDLLFFNFEDERLFDFEAVDLQTIIHIYNRLYPNLKSVRRALFLDEIQLIQGWETFVRRILDEGQYDVYLSGSSAKLLSREIATSMRGRGWEVEIFPFSFREILKHHQHLPKNDCDHFSQKERCEMDHHFENYLLKGGLPEAQGLSRADHHQLLQSYVDALLMRDIVERYNISNPTALRWMVRRLLSSPGGLFSISKFNVDLKSQGISVGKETLMEYLDHLEDAYLCESISIQTDSEKRRQVNPRKIYPIDTGFIPVFDRSAKTNLGHALESVVYLHLRRQKNDISYVKTSQGYEVDFYARSIDHGENLIQVSYSVSDNDTLKREVRALLAAADEHPKAKLLLLTGTSFPLNHNIPSNITCLPTWEWILRESIGLNSAK